MLALSLISFLSTVGKSKPDVAVYSDSAYIINCFREKWYVKWEQNNWKNSAKKKVENIEEWQELLFWVRKCENIKFYKIKGHLKEGSKDYMKWYKKFCDNEYKISKEGYNRLVGYNNLADELANKGADDYDIK